MNNVWEEAESLYQQQSPFDLAEKDYKKKQSEEENRKAPDLTQRIASFSSHAAGQIPALTGNIRDIALQAGEGAKNLRKSFYDKFGLSWDEDFLKNNKTDEAIKAPFKFLSDKLPNTQDVNKFIDESFGGYLAPKDEKQKIANEFGEDVVNSLLNRGPKGLVRNFLIPGVANAVRKGAELLGVEPENQYLAKFISWIGMDMAGLSNPRQMSGNYINQTRRQIPPNDNIPMNSRDIRFLDQLENRLLSGGTSPSKQAALTKIDEIRNASAQSGNVPARQMHDFYRTINELKTNYGAFNVEGSAKPAHVFNLNRVQNLTRNKLNQYGRNQNPEFLRDFRQANAAWATLEQSDAIANYVKKNYNKPFASEATRHLFSKSYGVPVAVGLTALERAQSLIQRLQNPTLRKYYGNILEASLRDNRAMMISNMNKLDEALKKQEDQ